MPDMLSRIRRNVNAVREADWGEDEHLAYHPEERCQADLDADVLLAHIDALTAAVDEPHHLGFPVSGKTGTYDRTAVIVKREWYERVLAILRGKSATGPNSPKTIVSGK
jgi:hypothetical protein